jgi:hypothetical protein
MKYSLYLLIFILGLVADTKSNSSLSIHNKYQEAWKHSRLIDANMLWIPFPNQVIGEDWLMRKKRSHFHKSKILPLLEKYGRTWDDLVKDPSLEFVDEGADEFSMIVGDTHHLTLYPYDNQIPILIHSPGNIIPGMMVKKIQNTDLASSLLDFLEIQNNPNPYIPLKKYSRAKKPKVLVMIVLDQGGSEIMDFHSKELPFFNKIKKSSLYIPQADIEYFEVHTLTGHSALASGLQPNMTMAFANEYYEYTSKGREMKFSAPDLWDRIDNTPKTIAEFIMNKTDHKASLISIGPAKRTVYPIMGKLDGKAIGVWQDKDQWGTDSLYYRLPDSISKWAKPYTKDNYSPEYLEPQLEIFLNSLKEEWVDKKLGYDDAIDFGHITLKATDYAGHTFGWESIPAEKSWKATDTSMAKIKSFLDFYFPGEYILIISSDHGCSPLPELTGTTRTHLFKIADTLNALVPDKNLIQYFSTTQARFNPEILKKYNLSQEDLKKPLMEMKDGFGNSVLRDVIFFDDDPKTK